MFWILYFSIHPIPALIFIFIIGAIVGSFLNVVIYRYPIMLQREWNAECLAQLNQSAAEKTKPFNLCIPRSHCPHCQKIIPWYFNIPLLSYIFLQGKCGFCRSKISFQYPLVELISAALPLIIFMKFGLTWQTAALIIFTWGLIAESVIDYFHQFLPDLITYCLLWLGLLISTQHLFISPTDAIIGAFIGYLFLWTVAKLFILVRKKEGMGLGDCKMLAMMGAWVGAMSLLNIVLFSSLLALLVSLFLMLFKKMDVSKPIPFGPFIAVAGWCTVIYGNQLMLWITRWL